MTTLRAQAGLAVSAGDALRSRPLSDGRKAEGAAPAPAGVMANRIHFARLGSAGAAVCEFSDPDRAVAIRMAADLDEILDSSGDTRAGAFDCIFVPGTAPNADQWQARALAWVGGAAGELPTVDVTLRNDRIVWRPGRAVIIGVCERFEEILPGLVEFAWYYGHLRDIEIEVQEGWARAEADVPLMHRVRTADLKRWGTVNEMTEAVTQRRIRFARLEPHLGKAPARLSPPARRVFSELLQGADIADRLEAADDRMEVAEDLYELANDRLSEFSYYRSEFWLEVWIIAILVIELAGIAWEIWAQYGGAD